MCILALFVISSQLTDDVRMCFCIVVMLYCMCIVWLLLGDVSLMGCVAVECGGMDFVQ